MTATQLLVLQTKRGAKAIGHDTATMTYDNVKNECRKSIENNSDRYRNLPPLEKAEVIKSIIIDYIMERRPLVHGYIDGENRPDTLKLVDKLVDDITNYGILSDAIADPRIYEIRGNGKEIKVEIAGRTQDLINKEGETVSFESVEQQEVIMRKILGDVRLTPKDALVSARTIEGYRVAAVHASVMGDDPNNPSEPKYHSFVLRKFNKTKFGLGDIIQRKALSDDMGRFLYLATVGGLTLICAGPTASGKTTLLNAVLKGVPINNRTCLAQNPSEIDMRRFDERGRVCNDVIHLEATEKEDPRPQDPTMDNVMAHLLRLSPVYVVLGELRTNKEFATGMMIMGAGHPMYASIHANSSVGAVRRYLRAYMAASGETIETALPGLTDLLKIIVIQKIMKDGIRRVIQISEVLGVDPNNPTQPLINDLYVYKTSDEVIRDESGNIKEIVGKHVRVGKISDKLATELKMEGIVSSQFDFLLKDAGVTKEEQYTGVNIETYGV